MKRKKFKKHFSLKNMKWDNKLNILLSVVIVGKNYGKKQN